MQNYFAQLHKDVVFGKSEGKIIWQPRIGCWYDDKIFSGEGLPAPYSGMDIWQVYESLNCSARLYEFNSCFQRVENPSVRFVSKRLNETDTKTTIHTNVGSQTVVTRRTPNSLHPITLKWEVETEEELRVAAWREENATWHWEQECYDSLLKKLGKFGAPTIFLPRMNVQCLYIEKMGVEKGIYALYDWQDQINAFFRALEENHHRLIQLINSSPIDIINFGENIHASTLSPDLFVKYHLPACQKRCDLLHQAGKFVSSHWDGNVKPLLPFAKETGLDGIEAITPHPQGDVSLEEIKETLGDEMFLLDGIPAVYFDDIYQIDRLIECVEKLIELFAPKLVLGISDEISSSGDIERIRVVNEIVEAYNQQ